MNPSKIFILIVILVVIGAAVLIINYTKKPLPEIQPIRLPVKEKVSIPENGEKPGEGKKLEGVKMVEIKKIKDEIKTEAKGEIIKYQEISFYSEGDFLVILENEGEFKSQLIERFKQSLIGVSAENFEFNLDQSKRFAVLKCDIKGAGYGSNSYDMHFLVGNWPFDLYQFKKYEKKLVYDGKIDEVPAKVIFEFPYAFSHCHEHVWPR